LLMAKPIACTAAGCCLPTTTMLLPGDAARSLAHSAIHCGSAESCPSGKAATTDASAPSPVSVAICCARARRNGPASDG
ncbi:MAG: hypothetical protein ACKOFH_00890, partial [Chthoniobacterales bacterium]